MIQVRNLSLFFIIFSLLILNHGFMLLRLSPIPNFYIPISELILLLSLATIKLSSIKELSLTFNIYSYLLWLIYGFVLIITSFHYYGIWAIRDANHVIESLFLVLGFLCVANKFWLELFFKILPYFFILVLIYAFGYEQRFYLRTFSPTIANLNNYEFSIFFNYETTRSVLLLFVMYLIIFFREKFSYLLALLASLVLFYTILTFTSRMLYIQIIFLILLFLLFDYKLSIKILIVLFFSFLLIKLFENSYLLKNLIQGRLNQQTSVNFIVHHAITSVGISVHDSDKINNLADGASLRFQWWKQSLFSLFVDIKTFLFGHGYGMPLIDYHATNRIQIREPHNSYLSILVRGGVIGFILWIYFQISLFKSWFKLFLYTKKNNKELHNRILILFVFIIIISIEALGQDAFEKPYNIIPYYFFWGIILRLIYINKDKVKID